MQENFPVVSTPAVFDFEGHPLRVIEIDGEPWFVARDVVEAVGVKWCGAKSIPHVPEEWKGVGFDPTPSGKQEVITLALPGVFFFLNRSDKPAALPLQKKVAGEILPSIHKHGHYSVVPVQQLPLTRDPFQTLQLHYDVLAKHDSDIKSLTSRTDQIEDVVLDTAGKFDDFLDSQPMKPHQCRAIQVVVAEKVSQLSGKYGIYRKFLFSSIYGFLKRTYNVNTYSAIASLRFDEVLSVIKNLALEQLPENVIAMAKGV